MLCRHGQLTVHACQPYEETPPESHVLRSRRMIATVTSIREIEKCHVRSSTCTATTDFSRGTSSFLFPATGQTMTTLTVVKRQNMANKLHDYIWLQLSERSMPHGSFVETIEPHLEASCQDIVAVYFSMPCAALGGMHMGALAKTDAFSLDHKTLGRVQAIWFLRAVLFLCGVIVKCTGTRD